MSDAELRALALGAGTPEGALAYARALRRVGRGLEALEVEWGAGWVGVEEAVVVAEAPREVWRRALPSPAAEGDARLEVGSGGVVVGTAAGCVRVFEPEDGALRWERAVVFREVWVLGPWVEVLGWEGVRVFRLRDGEEVGRLEWGERWGWAERVGRWLVRGGVELAGYRWVAGEQPPPRPVWRVGPRGVCVRGAYAWGPAHVAVPTGGVRGAPEERVRVIELESGRATTWGGRWVWGDRAGGVLAVGEGVETRRDPEVEEAWRWEGRWVAASEGEAVLEVGDRLVWRARRTGERMGELPWRAGEMQKI